MTAGSFISFQEPSFVFTEDFQNDFLSEYHKVFDKLRREFLVGEMVWNFADFMTVQGICIYLFFSAN